MFTRMLLLPMYPYLASEDVGYVCDTILRFYARRGSCPGGGCEQVEAQRRMAEAARGVEPRYQPEGQRLGVQRAFLEAGAGY